MFLLLFGLLWDLLHGARGQVLCKLSVTANGCRAIRFALIKLKQSVTHLLITRIGRGLVQSLALLGVLTEVRVGVVDVGADTRLLR